MSEKRRLEIRYSVYGHTQRWSIWDDIECVAYGSASSWGEARIAAEKARKQIEGAGAIEKSPLAGQRKGNGDE